MANQYFNIPDDSDDQPLTHQDNAIKKASKWFTFPDDDSDDTPPTILPTIRIPQRTDKTVHEQQVQPTQRQRITETVPTPKTIHEMHPAGKPNKVRFNGQTFWMSDFEASVF